MSRIEELEAELKTLVVPREGFQVEFNALNNHAREMVAYEHPAQWLFKQWLGSQEALTINAGNMAVMAQLLDHLVGIGETMRAGGFSRGHEYYRVARELHDTSFKIAVLGAELASLQLGEPQTESRSGSLH